MYISYHIHFRQKLECIGDRDQVSRNVFFFARYFTPHAHNPKISLDITLILLYIESCRIAGKVFSIALAEIRTKVDNLGVENSKKSTKAVAELSTLIKGITWISKSQNNRES